MNVALSLTQEQTLTALRSFLMAVLPPEVEVVQAQDNRVPEPGGNDYVVMTPMFRERLSTNVDGFQDALFTGSFNGTTLTISSVVFGELVVGSYVFGVNVLDGTKVMSFGTGTGGVGTYTVSQSQTLADETLAAGSQTMLQAVKFTVQVDVFGPQGADYVHIITTAFRDSYAVDQFAASGFDVAPLYMGDPRQMPFTDGEQQVENRWMSEAVMQCNPIVTVPQQFAASLSVGLIDVDVAYPPS